MNLVKSLKLQSIRERRDCFLCVLMLKCIHGLAPHYLSNDVTMVVDIHGYNTRSSENMDLYVPRCTKELCTCSFIYKGSMLWNDLPDILKESSSLDVFKTNYRFIIGWQISDYIWVSLYWGTYVYLKSWCLYFTFRVFNKRFFVLYFRILYQVFYGMTFI